MIKLMEYNGHIRNWRSLCSLLNIQPLPDRKALEEAILIRAFQKWGTDIGSHLNGMFAFALWDDDRQRLFCIRDQFGTRPFYYYLTKDQRLLYSSSIKKIASQEGFRKELDPSMLQLYLSFTYAPGENTFFKGLRKLLPGCYMIWENKKLTINRYWKPEFHPDDSKTIDEWADEIHSQLSDIMEELKDPEEKAVSFLSSGVDSSYILALSDISCALSCGYDDSPLDESRKAMETAHILNRECRVGIVSPEQYFSCIPYVMCNMEQPLGDASAPAFALSCMEAAKIADVCYSGEGADEFFAGYNMHKNAERYGDDLTGFYTGNTNIMREEEKKLILKHYDDSVLPIHVVQDIYKGTEGFSPLAKMLSVDIQVWLEGDIYLNVARMTSAAGIEVRMPMTDTRIFDIASRIPDKYKVDDQFNKIVLRTAASKVLPKEIAFRKKLGFVVPIRSWLADPRYNMDVIKRFHGSSAKKFFHLSQLDAIYNEYIQGCSDNWRKIWTIYTFLVWYEEFFLKL